MQPQYEAQYHRLEDAHWWFVGRRHFIREFIESAAGHDASILDVGCASGQLILELRSSGYERVTGIDISPNAIAASRRCGLGDTHVMDAQRTTFPDESFDIIAASDVLEHLTDAPGAVREWRRLLRPGGTLIVMVPAFAFLWSQHDEANQHVQRFTRPGLVRLLSSNGLAVKWSSYWNLVLFFPAAVVRLLERLRPKRGRSAVGDLSSAPHWINSLLVALLRLENRLLLRGVRYPVGLSVAVTAAKESSANGGAQNDPSPGKRL